MGTVLINANIYDHPAIIEATPRAFFVWVSGLCWSSQNGRLGTIPKRVVKEIRGTPTSTKSLIKTGLWIDLGDEFDMPKTAGYARSELWKWGAGDTISRPHIPFELREAVYARDGYACLHCGASERLSLDHIHPFSKGGRDVFDNLQTLCRSCNSKKGTR